MVLCPILFFISAIQAVHGLGLLSYLGLDIAKTSPSLRFTAQNILALAARTLQKIC